VQHFLLLAPFSLLAGQGQGLKQSRHLSSREVGGFLMGDVKRAGGQKIHSCDRHGVGRIAKLPVMLTFNLSVTI
jgi:hypothetical protein